MEEKPKVVLKNWCLEQHPDGVGRYYYRLTGNAYGHPKYPYITEGESIYTSKLISVDFVTGIAETLNTIYKLEGV